MGLRRGPRGKQKRNLVHKLAKRYGWKCFYCDRPLAYDGSPHLRPTLDHLLPLSQGGTNHWRNLALACRRCNHRRGSALGVDRTRLRRGVEHDGTLKRKKAG